MMRLPFIIFFVGAVQLIAGAQQRVVIIGLDGYSSEGFKKISHPNLDRLLSEGTYTLTNRPVMPSVTLPNWTSHLSGAGPEEHGVTGNDWTLQKHALEPIDKDEEGYFPSIFKLLKEKKPNAKIGYYYNWAALINSINKKYLDEAVFGEHEDYDSNYLRAAEFIIKNKKDPTLVFLYSVHTDHAGHQYGWMSPEYVKAIEAADVVLGRLIDKLKSEQLYQGTHFIFITDHGGVNKGHGGVSMLEMETPWGIAGPKVKRQGLQHFYSSNRNTSLAIARIFGLKNLPQSWTGQLPAGVFK
ncbi:alkaline phosphatase family protein [Niabella insulamsoli]|uniref:alkaline phosphatase family protein n=1 Tax=Niabella insulamsoli TaxID=3144874 RepID=UPI0031FD28B5